MAANSPGTYVDTPGGKMQAVALFYWNGSAWVPSNSGGSRTLYVNGAVAGNGADLTEDSLMSYSLPANTLANVGDTIRIFAAGALGATTDAKTVRIKFGTTPVHAPNSSAAGTTRWTSQIYITKTGSGTQSYGTMGVMQATAVGSGVISGTLTKTDTSPIAIEVTGQNATNSVANSVTIQLLFIEFIPAPVV